MSALAVIRLTRHKELPVSVKDEKLMFSLIRASFNQRRKTIVNAINNFSELSFTKDELTEALEKCGFNPNIRGEALSLADFARLSDALPVDNM